MTMYLEHFGLREAPFRITPHTEFFFAGANRGATLEALTYAVTAGEGMVKVTGEVGSGKTMLCRVLMERLPETVETIYLAVPSLSRDEMLAAIAGELDIDTTGAKTTRLVKSLQERLIAIHSAGRQVVVLIDEAHAMPLGTLEEIRLLSNLETSKEKLLQIVLFGQPELDEHLALPNMRQLKERITHSFTLGPLPPRDVDEYIRFRLRAAGYRGPDLFGAEALRIINEASEGLTRRINIYADKTLLAAFAAGTHSVTADHARAAVSDTRIVMAPRTPRRRIAAIALGGVAIGGALGFLVARVAAPPAGAPAAPAAAMVAPQGEPPRSAAPATPAVAPAATLVPAAESAPASTTVPAPAPGVESPAQATPASPPAKAAAPAATPSAPAVATPPPAPAGGTPPHAPAVATPPPAPAVATPQPAPAVGTPQPAAASPPAPRDPITARAEAARELLAAPGPARYSVQLMVTDARERAYLEAYLAEAGRMVELEKLFLVPSGSAQFPRTGVLFNAFETRAQAADALAALPQALHQFKPYVRSLDAVREEVRRAEGR